MCNNSVLLASTCTLTDTERDENNLLLWFMSVLTKFVNQFTEDGHGTRDVKGVRIYGQLRTETNIYQVFRYVFFSSIVHRIPNKNERTNEKAIFSAKATFLPFLLFLLVSQDLWSFLLERVFTITFKCLVLVLVSKIWSDAVVCMQGMMKRRVSFELAGLSLILRILLLFSLLLFKPTRIITHAQPADGKGREGLSQLCTSSTTGTSQTYVHTLWIKEFINLNE